MEDQRTSWSLVEKRNNAVATREHWLDGKECAFCDAPFSVTLRRHHCRFCGKPSCWACSKWEVEMSNVQSKTKHRACNSCYITYIENIHTVQLRIGNTLSLEAEADSARAEQLAGQAGKTGWLGGRSSKPRAVYACGFFVELEASWKGREEQQPPDAPASSSAVEHFVTKVDFNIRVKGQAQRTQRVDMAPFRVPLSVQDDVTAYVQVHLKDRVARQEVKVSLKAPPRGKFTPRGSTHKLTMPVCMHPAYQLDDTDSVPLTGQKGSPKRANSDEHKDWGVPPVPPFPPPFSPGHIARAATGEPLTGSGCGTRQRKTRSASAVTRALTSSTVGATTAADASNQCAPRARRTGSSVVTPASTTCACARTATSASRMGRLWVRRRPMPGWWPTPTVVASRHKRVTVVSFGSGPGLCPA
jgi:hypothetical protein